MTAFPFRSALKTLALGAALLGMAEAATSVTTTSLNLRRTPGGAVVAVIPANTLLITACDGAWCRTTYRGRGGYVGRAYLKAVTRSAPLNSASSGAYSRFYASCTAMRRAGAAPARVGTPGYRVGLDRNGNGWACDQIER
ncbi:excalibur calcium-binding domain-containing protein [Deinococcus ficus]|uniref:Ligand-binding protein SH3 n=1 Tax=Deinococcus ficus TaxID=317577 RepID=A0A221SSS4_9DEIO|nr:excalibur calcium-binding domain-containing protein [Deinococcus ficus]ASN79698.1 ligand-binding protein SH3 [Deinococcus ficus]